MKLVGASHAFIRMPFVIESLLPISVDYDIKIEDLFLGLKEDVTLAHGIDSLKFSNNFSGKCEKVIMVINFLDCFVTGIDLFKVLDRLNLRSANIYELVALLSVLTSDGKNNNGILFFNIKTSDREMEAIYINRSSNDTKLILGSAFFTGGQNYSFAAVLK